jgi:hypothetical protein
MAVVQYRDAVAVADALELAGDGVMVRGVIRQPA